MGDHNSSTPGVDTQIFTTRDGTTVTLVVEYDWVTGALVRATITNASNTQIPVTLLLPDGTPYENRVTPGNTVLNANQLGNAGFALISDITGYQFVLG